MSLLSYERLVELVKEGVIDAPLENVNGASIDLTLDDIIMIESCYSNMIDSCYPYMITDLKAKENIPLNEVTLNDSYIMDPGQFLLASTVETFNLPNNIAAEYKLKSSLARNGLQHMLAGWCDPGWHGSKLTLEFKNVNQWAKLKLTKGMKIGQVVFWETDPVPEEHSYATKGQYNGQEKVTSSKGVR